MSPLPFSVDDPEINNLFIEVDRRVTNLEGTIGEGLSHKDLKDISDHKTFIKQDGTVPMTGTLDFTKSGGIKNAKNEVLNKDIFNDFVKINGFWTFTKNLVIGGVLFFKETITPIAKPNFGALYTKNINELFFMDGDGDEHLLHGDAFSGMWFHSPTKTTVTISTADTFTKITAFENIGREDDLINVTSNISTSEITIGTNGGGVHDVTFHTSITSTGGSSEMVILVGIELNTPIDVTSATNATPIVVGKAGHGLLNGDMVTIVGGTGNTGVNGDWVVTSKTADAYTIVDLQGNNSVGNGTYDASSGDVTIFYPGNLPMHRVVSQTNLGVGGSNDDIDLVAGDKLAMYVANIGATRNLEIAVINLKSERIGD